MRLFRNTSLRRFVRELPLRQLLPLAFAIFALFAVLGPIVDILNGARQNIWLLTASTLLSGTLALGYGFGTMRGNHSLLGATIAAQFLWIVTAPLFAQLPLNPSAAAGGRAAADALFVLMLTMISYSCFLWFINGTAARYLSVRAEIALAHQIHEVLVPRVATTIGAFEFAGFSIPSGEVGGDLVDVVVTAPADAAAAKWFGYVADVSGHGVSSGLVMGMFKSALRMRLRQGGSLAEMLDDLNAVLFPLKSARMFVTAACIRAANGSRDVEYAVAGHLPILRVKAGGRSVEEITTPQIPVGIFEEYRFSAASIDCAPGDLLALITDGLTEVFDAQDRELGLERIKDILAAAANRPLAEIADALVAAARAHGPQLDDQTLLLIRRS